MARRLIQEINRTVDLFMNDHERAVGSNDQPLIQHVNQMLITIEQTANELRSLTNPPAQLRSRITDALLRADNLLSTHEPIQPQIRADETEGNRTQDEGRNTPPPPLDENVEALLYPGETTHRSTLPLSEVSLPLSSHHSHGAASEFFETREHVSGSGSRGHSSVSPSASRHMDAEAAAQAAQRQVDEERHRLESEANQLQMDRERMEIERRYEERELERRQRRLNAEMRNADSLEQARIRDQQENDQELSSHREGLTRDWVNNQAQFQPSTSTPAVGLTHTSPVLNHTPRSAAHQSTPAGVQQHPPSMQQPHNPMPQQQSQDPQLLHLIQQMQQQMQLQSQQMQQQIQQQMQQQMQQIRQEFRQQTPPPSLQPGAPPFFPNGAAPSPPPSQAGSSTGVAAAPSLLQGDIAQSLMVNLRAH